MIDIRQFDNGYWWQAGYKHESLVRGEGKLLELTIQMTDRCNKNCEKCNKTNFTDSDISTSRILGILEEALKLGLIHVHLTGGECTLHPGLCDIVEWCVSKGIRTDISSNGKFSKIMGRALAQAKVDSINVSYDVFSERPECFEFIFDMVKRVFVNHMVMPSNFRQLPEFIKLLSQVFPDVVDVQLMPPRGTAQKFTAEEVVEFNETIATPAYMAAWKYPMVQAKVLGLLGPLSPQGIYHAPILWPCHRSKAELRVGAKGYSTCTYLYRDGIVMAPLEMPVLDAWNACKKASATSPPMGRCDKSCSPEVCYFNLLVNDDIVKRSMSCSPR